MLKYSSRVKKMKKKYMLNLLTVFVCMFTTEMIFRIIAELPIFDPSVLRIAAGTLLLSTTVAFITTLMKYKVGKYIDMVIIFISSFYAYLQLGFNNFLGVYISLQNAEQGGAVKDYVGDFFASFRIEYYLCFIPFIIYLIYIIFFSKRFNNLSKMKFKYNILYSLFIICICSSFYFTSIINPKFENKFSPITNKDLFMTVSNQSLGISSFGTSMFGLLDVRTTIFKGTDFEVQEEIDFVNDKKNKEREITENSRIINDTAWEELINNTTNPTYNKLNNYFINQPIADKNDMTGIFEGKNVIFILMESTNEIIYEHPEYYPNFAKMASEGWYFENNYSPRNACATLNNEFSGMTSLYSINSICTAKRYRNNQYPESVFGIYNDANYITFSSHNYTEAYYPRSTIHTNMGSKDYYGVQRLGIPYSNEYINWSNDDDMMEAILKIIDKKTKDSTQPFMTWLTTVSGHQPYSVDSIQGSKYYSMTNNKNYPYDVKRFMSKLKIFDDGLGVLLKGLEERGILDDTVIVMYGDHYPYGISKDHLNKALSYNTNKDMSAEKVPLVIYNSATPGKKISSYTSYMNVLPTLANMFNLEYDPRLYLGEDVFSDDYESLVVFSDGSWKNEYAYYKSSSNKVTYYKDGYTEADIARINSVIETKFKISELAITNNYFQYLGKNLKAIKERLQNETMCLTEEKEDWLNGTHKSIIKVEDADVVVAADDGLKEDEGEA